jgi:hypothetical protein
VISTASGASWWVHIAPHLPGVNFAQKPGDQVLMKLFFVRKLRVVADAASFINKQRCHTSSETFL